MGVSDFLLRRIDGTAEPGGDGGKRRLERDSLGGAEQLLHSAECSLPLHQSTRTRKGRGIFIKVELAWPGVIEPKRMPREQGVHRRTRLEPRNRTS